MCVSVCEVRVYVRVCVCVCENVYVQVWQGITNVHNILVLQGEHDHTLDKHEFARSPAPLPRSSHYTIMTHTILHICTATYILVNTAGQHTHTDRYFKAVQVCVFC